MLSAVRVCNFLETESYKCISALFHQIKSNHIISIHIISIHIPHQQLDHPDPQLHTPKHLGCFGDRPRSQQRQRTVCLQNADGFHVQCDQCDQIMGNLRGFIMAILKAIKGQWWWITPLIKVLFSRVEGGILGGVPNAFPWIARTQPAKIETNRKEEGPRKSTWEAF